ncbi:MAG TPA: class I SAM-dependent methyltransferase [Chthonomonadaceae bacterium]|nr:class I SAM-dependent methyltransferase [Chthonomonadaceae bacterium]
MTQEMTPEMAALKARLKSTWEAGDYGFFARYLEPGALEFLNRLPLERGATLLDVGCGAGQLTIPAAKRGIKVTGLDLAQNLVDQARKRARQEGLDIRIEQGDAEALPFADGSFAAVMSLIGAMFAPRPERVAAEMLRVCQPGGKIIMGNWTPDGHVGQMFKIISKYAPPPAIFPSPLLWGDVATVRERFGNGVKDLRITLYMYPFRYPFSPAEVVDFFDTYYGPTVRASNALGEEAKAAYKEELTALWSRNNRATDGTTDVLAEYIEVVATRA